MEYALALGSFALVQLLAVMSPGQSFVIVSKLALSEGKQSAVAASVGMGVGSVVWAIAALAGMNLVLEKAAWLYSIIKLGGAAYLLYLAFQVWQHAAEKLHYEVRPGADAAPGKAFFTGLFTQLANPKVIVFFGSIFFALLPADSPSWLYVFVLLIIFCNETIWYAMVANFFSVQKTRQFYVRLKTAIDRVMALVLATIGLGLVYDTLSQYAWNESDS